MANNLIPGGTTSIYDEGSIDKGVYANFPAGTPKYHAGNGPDSVYRQARFYVDVPARLYRAYRASVPERSHALLDVLCVSSGQRFIGYIDFFLAQVNESMNEKVQVSEVLSDAYVAYFYGGRGKVYQLSGMLLNTQQDNWYTAFYLLYEDLIRGTRTSESGAELTLVFDDRRVIGSFTSLNMNINSTTETAVPFNAQFLVRKVEVTTSVRATLRSSTGRETVQRQAVPTGTRTQLLASVAESRAVDAVEAATRIAASVRAGADTSELSAAFGVDLTSVYAAAANAALNAFGEVTPTLGTSTLDLTRRNTP